MTVNDIAQKIFIRCVGDLDGVMPPDEFLYIVYRLGFNAKNTDWTTDFNRLCSESEIDPRNGIGWKQFSELLQLASKQDGNDIEEQLQTLQNVVDTLMPDPPLVEDAHSSNSAQAAATERVHVSLITVFADDDEAGFLCGAVNFCYSERHGYRMLPLTLSRSDMEVLCEGRHFAWAKVALLRWIFAVDGDEWLVGNASAKLLRTRLGEVVRKTLAASEWLVWLDADLMVINHELRIATLIRDAMHLVLGEHMAEFDWVNTSLLACNTSSAWVRSLWAKLWTESSSKFHHQEFGDQSGLCRCLAKWGEIYPNVIGGQATRVPAPNRPWFSWAGGLRRKKSEHMVVLQASALQINNPKFTEFAFHPFAVCDKKRSLESLIDMGAIRGLRFTSNETMRAHFVTDAAMVYSTEQCSAAWERTFDALFKVAVVGLPFPWDWQQEHRRSWKGQQLVGHVAANRDVSFEEQNVPSVFESEAPLSLSFAELSGAAWGDLVVPIWDCMPVRASDPPPASKPHSHGSCAQLHAIISYARGTPPERHIVLAAMDSSRLWRATWMPWRECGGASQPSEAPPMQACTAAFGSVGTRHAPRSNVDACIEIAPPGAVLRTHQPTRGKDGWLLSQLEGAQQVALLPPGDHSACAAAGPHSPLLPSWETAYDPWVDDKAKVFSAVLRRGEVLFVPIGWWLTARILQPSMCISRALGSEASSSAASSSSSFEDTKVSANVQRSAPQEVAEFPQQESGGSEVTKNIAGWASRVPGFSALQCYMPHR